MHFGRINHRKKHVIRTGDEILYMVKDLPEKVIFGKGDGGKSVPNDAEGNTTMWKKKSIFWDLPYWKHLEVHSPIDVMHVDTREMITVSLPSLVNPSGW